MSESFVKTAVSSRTFQICECSSCFLRFSDPMIAADSEWYRNSSLYVSRAPWVVSTQARRRQPVLRWEFQQALSFSKGKEGTLLDVGCGAGEFLYWARRAGFKVTGLDFNPASVELARRVFGISSVHECSIGELVDDPFETLLKARAVLRTGGSLCLSVPGYRRWPPLFDPEVDFPPHHLTMWTTQALERILERAGFRDVTVQQRPLEVKDLGVHLWWRMLRLRTSPAGHQPASRATKSDGSLDGSNGLRAQFIIRQLGLVALVPLIWLLRLNPKAGGFTLFAQATTP